MLEIWDLHGPPSFITLAAAHLDPKKRKKKKKTTNEQPQAKQGSGVGADKEQGTMGDLAKFFGIGGKKTKATI